MKLVLLCWFATLAGAPIGAMGFTEDPQERLTKSWTLEAVRSLEVRGQIDFELAYGPKVKVTVTTTRALFDQLTVSNWWGSATVAIESGLRGPREPGAVKAKIELPSLQELRVSDRSSGLGSWPGPGGRLYAEDHSNVELAVQGPLFTVETSWMTKVTLEGTVDQLRVAERHQSQVDATGLTTTRTLLSLDESSGYTSGPTGHGEGTVRHQSQVTVLTADPWTDLILKEDSVRTVQTEPPKEP